MSGDSFHIAEKLENLPASKICCRKSKNSMEVREVYRSLTSGPTKDDLGASQDHAQVSNYMSSLIDKQSLCRFC